MNAHGSTVLPTPPIVVTATMIARSHSLGEPRWSPSCRFVGWLDAWDSRTDLIIGVADGSLPPTAITSDFAVVGAGGYGGGGWAWLSDDEVVVAGADGRLVVLRRDGGGVVRVLSRDGTAFAPAVSPDGLRVACCVERVDACDVCVVPIDGSAWPVRASAADYAWDPAWSADSRVVAWHEWDLARMSFHSSRIALAVPGEMARVVAGGPGIAVGQPRFSPDGSSLAYVSDRDGWWNVWVARADGSRAKPLRVEPYDHAEPSWGPGQRTFAWSPASDAIAYTRNENGFGRLVVAGVRSRGAARDLAKAFHFGLDWGTAGILALRSGAKTPAQVTVTAPRDGARRVLARGAVGGFETSGLVEPEPVQWKSGRAIVYGLLRRPAVSALGADTLPPLSVNVHGGPTDQAVADWNPRLAYWVSRGYAVLSVNYRGSSGYGRAYRDALDGHWGVRDVADVAAGIRHAARVGWCDPDRVVVMGGSAGGFTVLLMAALHGDLLRAGVSLFGVGDLFDLTATTHRFESTYVDALVGELPQHADRYSQRSPITHAASIRVPMLVLQGRDDKVVPLAQAEAMVAAMRAAGAPVEYQVYDGEGHGFRQLANVIEEYERTEAFLTKWVLQR